MDSSTRHARIQAYTAAVLHSSLDYERDPFAASRLEAMAELRNDMHEGRLDHATFVECMREVMAW